MVPPTNSKAPSQADSDAPLSKWQTLAPFDDKASCEKIRDILLNFGKKKVTESATASPANRSKALLKYSKVVSSRCVEANDSRLNQK